MNDQHTKADLALTRRIMRRVYLVAAIRLLINPIFLKALIVSVFFWRSTQSVSYLHVFANAPSPFDIPSNLQFVRGAFMHAETTTTVLVLGMALLIGWIAVDMVHRKSHAWF